MDVLKFQSKPFCVRNNHRGLFFPASTFDAAVTVVSYERDSIY